MFAAPTITMYRAGSFSLLSIWFTRHRGFPVVFHYSDISPTSPHSLAPNVLPQRWYNYASTSVFINPQKYLYSLGLNKADNTASLSIYSWIQPSPPSKIGVLFTLTRHLIIITSSSHFAAHFSVRFSPSFRSSLPIVVGCQQSCHHAIARHLPVSQQQAESNTIFPLWRVRKHSSWHFCIHCFHGISSLFASERHTQLHPGQHTVNRASRIFASFEIKAPS